MRKLLSLTLLLSSVSLCIHGQNSWQDMMHDRSANFFDIVADFEIYHDSVMEGLTEIPKGSGIKQFRRWEYYWGQRVDENGNFPAPGNTLLEAYRYENDNANRAYVTGTGTWEIVGPVPSPANGTGQPNGNGRVNCIAFHPTDANTLFVGAPSGGFWKSTDNGSSWTEYSDGLTRLGVSSIVVHPTTPNTMYIATGDRDGGDAPGYGVWRTTDGGVTWSPRNSGMGNRTVYEILMHPSDPNILIASTSSSRIYRSTNGGASWTYVSIGTNCKDIAFHPTNPNIVYGAGGSFVRSTDNGVSFTTISSGIDPASGRMAIGVSPDEPNWVYLLGGDGDGLIEIVRSTDSGLNFSVRTTTPNILGWNSNGGDVGSQYWYDLVMAVNPNDASEIYTGGVNIWKSTNGGTTMTISGHWTGSGGADDVHADHHALEFSPHTNTLYNGNDGGVYYSTDNGVIWNDITSGLAIAQVYKIGVAQTVEELAINGYQDNGTSVSEGTSFRTEIGGDGMECLIDPTDANYMYGSLYYGAIRRSSNYGVSFGNIAGGISEQGGWVTPFTLDPGDENRMYAGFDNVWRTNNVKAGTVSWTQISSFGGTNNCVDLAVAPSNTNVVYVSRSSGAFYRSSNAQAGSPTWTDLSANLPTSSTPKDIEIDPLDPDHLFIAQSSNIYESTDGGGSWTDFSGTLPNISLNTIVIDQNSPVEAMYVGMDVGVYYRDNNMSDWEQFRTGLPNIEVTELNIYYNTTDCSSMIYAGTYAQGLWKSDLKDPGTVAPIACFESDVQVGCTATPIEFTDLSSYGPTGWTWTFSPNTVTFIGGTNANSQNPEVEFNATGLYTVTLTATNANGNDVETKTDYISIINSVLTAPTLTAPADLATGVAVPASFSWSAVTGTSITYDIDIATDAGFSSIIDSQTGLTTTTYSSSSLASNTTYYWRVKAFENCAESPFTSTYSFTTGNCTAETSTDVPITIPTTVATVTSTLNVAAAGTITSVSVASLDITHTWINDLEITLMSPGGTTVSLVDQICGSENDIIVTLEDGASSAIGTDCPPTVGNSYQPDQALAGFNGENAAGIWTLTVTDHANQDGGTVNGWTLGICTNVISCTDASMPSLSLDANPVCPGGSTNLNISGSLNDATAWEVYTGPNGTGTHIGSVTGASLAVSATGSITYYVRGEGGCTSAGPEASITLNGVDNTNPTAICQDLTIYLDGSGNATITAADVDNGSSDNCGTANLSINNSTFDCSDIGANTVTLTVTDGTGNSSTCTSTVTVADTTPPTAICQDLTIYLDGSGNATITAADVDNGSSDNCGTANLSINNSTFDCSDIGANTVTLTVADGTGNSSTCTSTVTVADTTPPTAICQDLTIYLDGSGNASITAADVDNGSSDNCGTANLSINNSSFNCSNIGANTVTLTVTDNNSNSSTCTATVTVADTTSPTALCQNHTVALDANGNATITASDVDGGSSDNCGSVSLSVSPSSFTCADVGANTVTLTVNDGNGNSSTCTSTVTVNATLPDAAGAIIGSTDVCAGTTQTYVVPGISNATSYAWTLPAGWTGTSTSNTITVTVGTASGNVSVEGVNACGSGTASSLAVSVNDIPTGSFTFTTAGLTVNFTDASTNSPTNWSWDLGDGASSIAQYPAHAYTVGGTYVVCLTATNTCGSSAPACQNVTVAGVGTYIWTGNTSTDWNTPTNWSPNGIPNGDDVIIPNVVNDPVISAGITGSVNNIDITIATPVTIAAGGELQIGGDLTWNGTNNFLGEGTVTFNGSSPQQVSGTIGFHHLNVDNTLSLINGGSVYGGLVIDGANLSTNNQLIIRSNASGTGWIMPYLNGGGIVGNVTVQRYVQQAGFHHFGSPINTPLMQTELSEMGLSGPNGGQVIPTATCSPNVDPSSPYGKVFEWNQGNTFSTACFYWGWNVRSSGPMTNARGYAGIFNPNATLTINGTVNSGTITNPGLLNSGGTGNGFHLASNPYPSPMVWVSPAGFDGAAYFWQNSGPYSGTYQAFLSGAGHQVASMQGFFTRVSGGPANFTTTDAQRISGDPAFFRQASPLTENLKITVTGNGFADKTDLVFHPLASDQWESELDALKVPGNADQPTIYTRNLDDLLSINSIAPVKKEKYIVLGFNCGENGDGVFDFEFKVRTTDPPIVFIEDLLTGRSQQINDGSSFQFNAKHGQDNERFLLHFYPAGSSVNNSELIIYQGNGALNIAGPDAINGAILQVYDMLGQLIHTQQITSNRTEIANHHWTTGAYLIRVTGIISGSEKVRVE